QLADLLEVDLRVAVDQRLGDVRVLLAQLGVRARLGGGEVAAERQLLARHAGDRAGSLLDRLERERGVALLLVHQLDLAHVSPASPQNISKSSSSPSSSPPGSSLTVVCSSHHS